MPEATNLKNKYIFSSKEQPHQKNDRGLSIHISHMKKINQKQNLWECGEKQRRNLIPPEMFLKRKIWQHTW